MMVPIALLLGGCSAADPKIIAAIRADLAANGAHNSAALDTAVAKLTTAEQSCSADEQFGLGAALAEVRSGYARLSELLKAEPADTSTLEKAVNKAKKKRDAAHADLHDDEELVSKAEKAAKTAKLAKAEEAWAKARAAVEADTASKAVREPRTVLMSSLADGMARSVPELTAVLQAAPAKSKKPEAVTVGGVTAKVQILSRSPLVLTLDDWLGPTGLRALEGALAALKDALQPAEGGDAPESETDPAGKGHLVPSNASELGDTGEYTGEPPQKPALCVPVVDGVPDAALLKVIDGEIAKARKAKAQGKAHCDATAGPLDEQPADWDEAEDGALTGTYTRASDRYGNATGGCGPLTAALDATIVTSDAVTFTASANASVDVLDAAVSDVVGFGIDLEALGREVLDGLGERIDPSAVQPDDWDADEDGEWEAPRLPPSTAEELWFKIFDRGGGNASSLADSYAFSSSPMLVRTRAGKGGEGMVHDCDYFGKGEPRAAAAIVALLQLSPTAKKGGEIVLPALGVSVPAVRGRLTLIETVLPDGTCDPSSARAALPLPANAGQDKVSLIKTFYADRTFSRERSNSEGPQRTAPRVDCGARDGRLGCRRAEHVPAVKGEYVLPLRGARQARECMAAGAPGPCIDPNYTPPPPPPKKAKKAATPPSTPPAEGPRAPIAPGAPPPVPR